MSALRFRQVHLDFHTSEKIPGVGADFDAKQFAEMLQRGHVDSITLFSKCHHGMTYHDTKVGVRHPGMDKELLPRQIEACRSVDVKTPIYLSTGWDEAMARTHTDWVVRDKSGKLSHSVIGEASWKLLCFNSPYLDYLCAQIDEVIERFDGGDGIFFDVIHAHPCYCNYCLRDMEAAGLDAADDAQMEQFSYRVLDKYFQRTTAACHRKNPELRVFHNSGHIAKGALEVLKYNSHLEIESLPTGGWGYDHFPLSAKYVATTGFDFLGMTGKFHTTWGEFGGFKRANALRYECDAMIAFGSKCSVGDQLHPRGRMDEDTYNLIGAAYEPVQQKEAWCRGAKPWSEVALLSPEVLHADKPGSYRSRLQAEEGAARMLLETQIQFDIIDLERDLSSYKLVILPDEIELEEASAFTKKLQRFIENGGKILMSGRSGMNADHTHFVLDAGLKIEGRSDFSTDYIVPGDELPSAPVRGRFVVHGAAWNVAPQSSTRTLAARADPYFNRAWNHFCSHQHTPDEKVSPFPAITANENIVYFAHEIFTCYRNLGQPLYRDLVRDTIEILLGKTSFSSNLPTAARASLMRQEEENRYVLHLLYANPVKRGADVSMWGSASMAVEVIEDLVPLLDVQCEVRVPQPIESVRLVPSGEPIEYSIEGETVRFCVPKFLCHQMVELKTR